MVRECESAWQLMGSELGGCLQLQSERRNRLSEMVELKLVSCQILVPEQVLWVQGLKKLLKKTN